MATLAKITPADLSAARKAGFKKKRPKKPRASASLTTLENYVVRYNQWVKDARAKVSEKRTKMNNEKKRKSLRTAITRL